MNVWTFSGRLGADAELRNTQGGEKVANLRVANDVGYGDRKVTQWVDCSIWGRRAEALAPHLTKGTMVMATGEVTIREYEKRDGTRGSCLSVRITDIDLLGGGQQQHQQQRERDSVPPHEDTPVPPADEPKEEAPAPAPAPAPAADEPPAPAPEAAAPKKRATRKKAPTA